MGKIRGTHSSPGIYTQITDLSYAAQNLGITSLGLVGETLKGPAFEPIPVSKWDEFVNYFGGTSPEKFKDSQYPKYELPYIAQSYLKASDRLQVCRVLGLSGYNAGPAFVIMATNGAGTNKYVVAVLRSRGKYTKYGAGVDNCEPTNYDRLVYDCDNVIISDYVGVTYHYSECSGTTEATGSTNFVVNSLNKGRFTLVAMKGDKKVGTYAVSLNAGSKDYIYNVLGSDPNEGSAALFVEELYDAMLDDLIDAGKVDRIYNGETATTNGSTVHVLKKYDYYTRVAISNPVLDFVTIPYTELKRSNVGERYIFSTRYSDVPSADAMYVKTSGETIVSSAATMVDGNVYVVEGYTDENGNRKYGYFLERVGGERTETDWTTSGLTDHGKKVVKVLAYNDFVTKEGSEKLDFITEDFCNYREQFRYASTPWIVSELKGSKDHAEVKKLFRFHTITDGKYANTEVKISIANIRPDEGTFDVLVRDFNDSDSNPVILESYKNLNMVPGTNKYIGLKIGTIDGEYELKSKYVMVEVINNEMTENCVPAGFLGYPVRDYGANVIAPFFTYNEYYDSDVRERKQYFGLSDITGVDVDMLNYKGKKAYTENYAVGHTNGFHLDSTLSKLDKGNVWIDGEISGASWTTVSVMNVTKEGKAPIIGTEEEMEGTIYEDVRLRKFTVYPCGGFDGWDIYRKSRTNTNEFKASKYKGTISNGEGANFSRISDAEGLALSGNCITSDYYAYLAGINQFENPEKNEINLFATPGIDYVNNEFLVHDAIDMVENRLDTLYIITTPDKPFGAGDEPSEMYSSLEVASNLEDTSVDTYYGCTYYPWVKYFDKPNNRYINLPATKDAVRNMANTDNKRYPWVAPAGLERGTVECQRMHFFAKLEDRDSVYDNRINALVSYSKDGVKIWGNKTLYVCEDTNPLNRINAVRLMLYMRKLIIESVRGLIFEPNDATLKEEFEGIIKPILSQIKADRGITDYELKTSQTKEQMDAHEISATLWVAPTPSLEYIEIEFVVTPQGVEFNIA